MSYEPTVWVDGDHVTSAKLNKLEQGVNSMSYTPTVWNAGDVVTAEKLNKLEQGVAESGGGGDFTMAEVTIISESTIDAEAYLPVAYDIPEAESPDAEGSMFIPLGETVVCNAIMFKGACYFQLATIEVVIKSVSGNATKTDIDTAMIKGNCTITVGDVY